MSGAGRLRREARQAQRAAQKRVEAAGPHGAALRALIARQAFIALLVGWGIAIAGSLVFALIGGDFRSGITRMCVVLGTIVVALGLFSTTGSSGARSRWGGDVLAGAYRVRSERGAPPMGYGLTFTAQCLVVGLPMLLIAALLSR